MFRGGRGRAGRRLNRSTAPLKGLFSDGVWQCNCDPRLPAQRFQTKNGGKNHGRWFYTCQLPQTKRCDFFLWADEAKGREAAAVLNNSRTEPVLDPTTPSKPINGIGLETPQTAGSRVCFDDMREGASRVSWGSPAGAVTSPAARTTSGPHPTEKETKAVSTTANNTLSDDDEFFDWPASDDEALSQIADQISRSQPAAQGHMLPPETPRKARKIDVFSTPSGHKRQYDEMAVDGAGSYPTPLSATADRIRNDGDVFTARHATARPVSRLLFDDTLPTVETPTPTRFRDAAPRFAPSETNAGSVRDPSSVASEVFSALSSCNVTLPPPDSEVLRSICDRHELRVRGITRGRDVLRQTLKDKENTITSLRGEIEALRSERETNRAVIALLRQDMIARRESGRGGRR